MKHHQLPDQNAEGYAIELFEMTMFVLAQGNAVVDAEVFAIVLRAALDANAEEHVTILFEDSNNKLCT